MNKTITLDSTTLIDFSALLPDEVLSYVFMFFPPDLELFTSIRLTCWRWKHLISDKKIVIQIFKRILPESTAAYERGILSFNLFSKQLLLNQKICFGNAETKTFFINSSIKEHTLKIHEDKIYCSLGFGSLRCWDLDGNETTFFSQSIEKNELLFVL